MVMKGSALLKSIRLQNIRSLSDTKEIPICPLTLLVGGNSSGKSTFLRTFPLIRQSISKRTDGPILWAGDVDDYVDFGSFKETKGQTKNSIDLSFSFKLKNNRGRFAGVPLTNYFTALNKPCDVNYYISIHQKPTRFGRGEEVSLFGIELNKHKVEIEYVHSKVKPYVIYVDRRLVTPVDNSSQVRDSNRLMLYRLMELAAVRETIFGFQMPSLNGIWDALESFVVHAKENDLSETFELIEFIAKVFLCEEDPIEFLKNAENSIRIRNKDSVIYKRFEEADIKVHHFIEKYEEQNKKRQEEIQNWFILFYLYASLEKIEKYISTYFRGVHYIAPLRATAERFYRLRNLAVDEIDYQGKNMAVFLNSLSKEQLQDFQNWTHKYFDFVVQLSTKAQHISVKIARNQKYAGVNISDSGFGYSQILPIIAQLWFLSSKSEKVSNYSETMPIVIAIEQPELHLHPALQAKLVDAFMACINNANEHHKEFQLIVETHSETIVNRIGRNIARGIFPAEKAEVVLFEKEFDSNQSNVRISSYDDSGMLTNWPIGFFEAGGM